MNAATDLTGKGRKLQAVEARRDLRRSYEARVNFWHAAIASLFFVVVLGASFFLGAVMVVGAFRGWDTSSLVTADGRTGRVARPLNDGTLCHYMVFDNKTAMAVEDRIGRCDEGKPKAKLERPRTFSWGGK
jgi:hypothetical protein